MENQLFKINKEQVSLFSEKGLENLILEKDSSGNWHISSNYIRKEEIEIKDFNKENIAQLVLKNHWMTNIGIRLSKFIEQNNLPPITLTSW
jgi:hypothetical protein